MGYQICTNLKYTVSFWTFWPFPVGRCIMNLYCFLWTVILAFFTSLCRFLKLIDYYLPISGFNLFPAWVTEVLKKWNKYIGASSHTINQTMSYLGWYKIVPFVTLGSEPAGFLRLRPMDWYSPWRLGQYARCSQQNSLYPTEPCLGKLSQLWDIRINPFFLICSQEENWH